MKSEEQNPNNRHRIVFPYKGTPFVLTDYLHGDDIKDCLPCVVLFCNLTDDESFGFYINENDSFSKNDQEYYERYIERLEYKEQFQELVNEIRN